MKIENLLEQHTIAFCEEHGIDYNSALKRRFEPLIFYFSRRNKWIEDLEDLEYYYTNLVKKASDMKEYYEKYEVPTIAPYTNERMSFEIPDFDFNLDVATLAEQISNELDRYNGSSLTKEIMDRTNEIMKAARYDFLKAAYENAPEDCDVMVVRSGYKVAYREHQESFEKSVAELKANPSTEVCYILQMFFPEYFAVCPKFHEWNGETMQSLVNEWGGYPVNSSVEYL